MSASKYRFRTRTWAAVAGVLALGLIASGCSSSESDSSATSSPSAASTTAPYPVSGDGSIITPSGYVFEGDFAICNQAKCGKPDADGNAQCTCDVLTDTWTLSPVPTSSFTQLADKELIMSTFTTTNVTKARSVKCTGGQWADCYGAICSANDDGTATCTCPVSKENPGEWMKYVDDCSDPDAGCGADLVSVAPLFPQGNPSYSDFVAAVTQAGASVPGIPEACPVPSATSSE